VSAAPRWVVWGLEPCVGLPVVDGLGPCYIARAESAEQAAAMAADGVGTPLGGGVVFDHEPTDDELEAQGLYR